jgi:hypothetical protein|tara:strand:+ start:402 stop:659 length:258 start_codon:yes stop_codon:yes gene_type:complete
MGFHKRHISNDQVIDAYSRTGIAGVEELYLKGADALILELGLASEIDDILSENYEPKIKLTKTDKWNNISSMVSDALIDRMSQKK